MSARHQRMAESRKRGKPWEYRRERGPDGQRLCYICGTVLDDGRMRYCTEACACLGRFYNNMPATVQETAWHNSRGECADCGVLLSGVAWVYRGGAYLTRGVTFEEGAAWEVHHIVPLCEGGWHEPSNVVAMCEPCHKAETKALAGRRAAARRKPGPQQRLALEA